MWYNTPVDVTTSFVVRENQETAKGFPYVQSLFRKQNAKAVGAAGFQHPGCGVGHIAHIRGDLSDPVPGLSADIRRIIEGFTDSSYGITAFFCDHLNGYHRFSSLSGGDFAGIRPLRYAPRI